MATFTVSNIKDSGKGSLRKAIEQANTIDGYDRIEFSDRLSGQKISLISGELTITDDLAIDGLSGNRGVSISGNNASRIFTVDDSDASNQVDVVINDLTITEGKSNEGGGAIANAENLTINNSVISNNQNTSQVPEAGGGAIRNSVDGQLNINESLIKGNQSQAFGGGITNFGQLFFNSSTITNNQVSGGGGGGIDNRGIRAEITGSAVVNNLNNVGSAGGLGNGTAQTETSISNSIIAGNHSFIDGAGLFVNAGNVTVTDSIIEHNKAQNSGGGIGIAADGNLTLNQSSVINNEAVNEGGGFFNLGSATIDNSTVTGNIASDGGGIFNANVFESSDTLILGNIPNDALGV